MGGRPGDRLSDKVFESVPMSHDDPDDAESRPRELRRSLRVAILKSQAVLRLGIRHRLSPPPRGGESPGTESFALSEGVDSV